MHPLSYGSLCNKPASLFCKGDSFWGSFSLAYVSMIQQTGGGVPSSRCIPGGKALLKFWIQPCLPKPKATHDPANQMCSQLETFIQRSCSRFSSCQAAATCPAAHSHATKLASVPSNNLDPSLHMVSALQLTQVCSRVHLRAQSTVIVLEIIQCPLFYVYYK